MIKKRKIQVGLVENEGESEVGKGGGGGGLAGGDVQLYDV